MSTEPFLEPRLVGARFEGHAIPLEVLKDLAVLQDMIVEVAKWKFLQDHTDRKRSPRGFTDGIEIKLTGIEDGSAKLIISLVVAASGLLLPPLNQNYFEHARDAIINAIAAAEHDGPITDHLPEKSLGYFDIIGRSLRDNEGIEFTTARHQTPVRLTKATRRKLVLASSAVEELTEEVSIRGTISEADKAKKTFQVELLGGRKIGVPLDSQHRDTILEAFDGYETGTRVLLQGIGRYDRNERLLKFDSLQHISILDDLDVPARLDELRLLKDGWLEGCGKVLDPIGLDWLSTAFEHHYPDDVPLPYTYPTPEGGIQFEWTVGANEASLEIDLRSHFAKWYCLNTDTDAESTKELNLDKVQNWGLLVNNVRQLTGETA